MSTQHLERRTHRNAGGTRLSERFSDALQARIADLMESHKITRAEAIERALNESPAMARAYKRLAGQEVES